MKICELIISSSANTSELVSILAMNGYKISVKEDTKKGRYTSYINSYIVIVEKEADYEAVNPNCNEAF